MRKGSDIRRDKETNESIAARVAKKAYSMGVARRPWPRSLGTTIASFTYAP